MHMVKLHGWKKKMQVWSDWKNISTKWEYRVLLDDKAGTMALATTALVYYSHLTLVYVNRIIKQLIHMNAIASSNKTLNL